jgi:hypothetical protein
LVLSFGGGHFYAIFLARGSQITLIKEPKETKNNKRAERLLKINTVKIALKKEMIKIKLITFIYMTYTLSFGFPRIPFV